jgi:hypothetical protein
VRVERVRAAIRRAVWTWLALRLTTLA